MQDLVCYCGGSLDILCSKLITLERVQLSKSMSLLSKVVLVSSRITCLKGSMFMGVSSSMVDVITSPLIGPMGLGVCWVLKVWVSSTTWIVETVWCVGRLLILPSSMGITYGLVAILFIKVDWV